MRHLPEAAQKTVAEAGWNEETILILLIGFIMDKGLNDELCAHLDEVAAEAAMEP